MSRFLSTPKRAPQRLTLRELLLKARVILMPHHRSFMRRFLYVFRTLVNEDIPLNDGCLDAIKIVIPPKSLLAPTAPAAVVAGNVETSQAVTNALYGALRGSRRGTRNDEQFNVREWPIPIL